MDLGTILDGIQDYNKVFAQFGYVHTKLTGSSPWSMRVTHADGSAIEFRATDWVYKGPRVGVTVIAGRNAKDLRAFLLEGKTREELMQMLLTA